MADDHAAVAQEMSVGARIGGSSMVVTLVSTAHAMSHAYGALLPLIVPFFVTDLQLTYTQLGLIFSLSNLVWSPLQLGFGVLGRYCSRRLLLGIGNMCQAAAIIGTSLVHGFADLLSWRVIARIADAPQHPIGNSLISQSFRADRRGLALAINAAGSNLGTVAVPLIGGFLIATLGWRTTLVVFGLPGLLIGLLLVCLLEEHRGETHHGQGAAKIGAEVWALLRHRDALLLLTSHVIGAGGRGLGVATIYVPLYLSQSLQVDEVQLGILLTIMMVGSVVGPLIAGPLSDRIGRKPVLFGDYAIACLCFVGLLTVGSSGSSWALPAVLTVTGIAVYSEGALMQTALADVADRTSMDMLFGLYFTVGAAIGAPWAVLIGVLVDGYGFGAAFIAMAASQVLAALVLLPVRLRRTLHAAPGHS
ncbi:MAG: MFS transporter [Candidatus Tectomicrobia bacterium]|jgi:FSR family fosmidomycin resistance protein-like MFS transporter|nr:MFS transporter [Candidatus Tectomicrobia bacterium]HEX2279838.1 MFS transporter [Candidatus Tectomicrobia bacterium]